MMFDAERYFENEWEHISAIDNLLSGYRFIDIRWSVITLVCLGYFKGEGVCVSDVYHRLPYPRETTIRIVNELVERGLLRKGQDSTDKRRKMVHPTFAACKD